MVIKRDSKLLTEKFMPTFPLMSLNLITVRGRNIWNTLAKMFLISMKLFRVDTCTLGLVQPESTALLLTFKPSFFGE